MRAVVQRAAGASVRIEGRLHAEIGAGLLVLAGAARGDDDGDAAYLADKLANLRILDDADGRMNRSVLDEGAEVLLVSQFTLLADTRKGRRPSFMGAEAPERAAELLQRLAQELAERGVRVETGQFQAMMDVALVNRGPVTLVLDSRDRHTPRRQA